MENRWPTTGDLRQSPALILNFQTNVIHCMRDFVPRDKAEAVLQLELERLDQMQASVYKNAASGGYCGD